MLHKFGGGGITTISPLVLTITITACILILLLDRKKVLAIFMTLGLILPYGQALYLAGVNLSALRIIVIFGVIKSFFSTHIIGLRLTVLDKCILCWVGSCVVTFSLLWMDSGALVNKIGFLINVAGTYAIFRWAIQDWEDMDRAVRVLSYISVIIMICMIIEQVTSRNPLSFLGKPEAVIIRDGKIRSTAGFAHPILAGMFGGTSIPLFVFLMLKGRQYLPVALLGILSATIITFLSASSTPFLSYMAGIGALCMWPLRHQMRAIRWGITVTLVALHLAMKAPVWALISRVDVIGTSSGYHRFKLVDEFINRFGEWWILGTKSTTDWGWDMWDTVNQFVNEGVNGGLITFILFLSIIIIGFKIVGRKMKEFGDVNKTQLRIWALGSALFSHVVGFFGIVYFDQMQMPWLLLLAIMSLLSNLTNNTNLVIE